MWKSGEEDTCGVLVLMGVVSGTGVWIFVVTLGCAVDVSGNLGDWGFVPAEAAVGD